MEIWETVAAIIVSFGGAGTIIIACSSWLGNLWAKRIMENERHEHQVALEALRADLSQKNQEAIESVRASLELKNSSALEKLKAELEINNTQSLTGFHDRLKTYRLAVDILCEVLGDLDIVYATKKALDANRFDQVNRARLKIYGYLAMLAPQNIMDANDAMFDHLIEIINSKKEYEWNEIRALALTFLNAMRQALGFHVDQVNYNGKL